MIVQIWICQVFLAIASAIPGNEVLPEKYLKPRDFNYHPYIDLGTPASRKSISALNNAYARLAKHGHSNQNVLFYPNSNYLAFEKNIERNELPKNYAFAYTVKDQLSGDDFSHSQAHNGKRTRGQYKVKLPDGRTQIVSYTADHQGYRADVRYEDNNVPEKTSPDSSHHPFRIVASVNLRPATQPNAYQQAFLVRKPTPINSEVESVILQSLSLAGEPSKSFDYLSRPVTISPLHAQYGNDAQRVFVKYGGDSTIAPRYHKSQALTKFVSALAPHQQGQHVLTTVSPQYPSEQYISTTPIYSVDHITSIPSAKRVYQSYPTALSSTHHAEIYVTPSPI